MSVTPGRSTQNLDLPSDAIAGFCRKWKITKLEVFGSALREDFGPGSDVDFMVTFDQQARWSLFDLVDAEQEMSAIVGRPVDLVERIPIEKSSNWTRRKGILESARTIYVA
ncbi:MAG: nucleotidyltransferase domain-containing protein [Phycisphaerae bacterium]